MKTFSSLRKINKDIVYIVHYAEDSTFTMTFCYNQFNHSYMGTKLEIFGDTLRGLLRVVPEFIEEFCEFDPKRSLKKFGFVEVEPTRLEQMRYDDPESVPSLLMEESVNH